MKLIDAILLSVESPGRSVICARKPFHQSSDAVIVQFEDDFSIPPRVSGQGYVYFLGRDDVAELLEMIGRKLSSKETKAEFVCFYASWDAYPAFYNDLNDLPMVTK